MDIITNIQENAYDDTQLRADLALKADKTQVATDIADAVKVETDARVLAVQGVQDAVNTLSGTHATDKKALEDAIALKADITALDAVSGVANAAATKTELAEAVEALEAEDDRIEGLVTAEAAKAREEEGKLAADIKAITDDYLKAADKTELEGKITANANAIELLTNGVSAEEVDGVNDLIQYVKDHGTEVTGMKEDIAKNAEDIEALSNSLTTSTDELKDYADDAAAAAQAAAEATAAADAKAKAEAAQAAAIAAAANDATTKANAAQTAAEAKAAELANAAEANAKEYVDDMNIAGTYATKVELNTAKSDLTTEINKKADTETVNAALELKADTETVNTALELKADKTALAATDAEVAKKANDADLAAIAKTGLTDDLVQGIKVLVFDCGTSAV